MRCKAGDLAFIVGGKNSSNLGRVVECLYMDIPWSTKEGEPMWRCRIRGSFPGVNFLGEHVISADEGVAADRHLRPINGIPVEDEVTREQEITT